MDALHSKPVDRVAARVIFRGDQWESSARYGTEVMFQNRPPVIAPPKGTKKDIPTENLVGRKSGRLTVVGYLGRAKKRDGAKAHKWVCRCQCGLFTVRTGLTIKNPSPVPDMCQECRHLERLKNRAGHASA